MLRNRKVRQFAVMLTTIIVTIAAAGFATQPVVGILALTSVVALGTVFLVFTKTRYRGIAELSEQIGLVLHNSDRLFIGETNESELSTLQSEITKMALRIRKQNDALEREKEHLTEPVADIAYQLRAPLTSVDLVLPLLENNPDERERRAMIRETEGPFVQMDWLLASLSKLSRLDTGITAFQRRKTDVHDLISSVLRPFLTPMDLYNITLRTDVPKEILIQGGSGQLSEAIQSILKNCLESAGNDGKIVIACEDNPLFTEIIIRSSGVGFAKEGSPHLLSRFYRGKHVGVTRYGIELVLHKTIITRQGGIITAKDHPQGGAVLSIRFLK